jgi:hypothetical protein
MESDASRQVQPQQTLSAPAICPYCHQPVEQQWYFCPNCGTKLDLAPLSTSIGTQLWIYAFSIVLPMICFLAISKWPGMKYYRSEDKKTKTIGTIAWVILVLSTLVTVWYAYVWTQETIKSSIDSINADLSI